MDRFSTRRLLNSILIALDQAGRIAAIARCSKHAANCFYWYKHCDTNVPVDRGGPSISLSEQSRKVCQAWRLNTNRARFALSTLRGRSVNLTSAKVSIAKQPWPVCMQVLMSFLACWFLLRRPVVLREFVSCSMPFIALPRTN